MQSSSGALPGFERAGVAEGNGPRAGQILQLVSSLHSQYSENMTEKSPPTDNGRLNFRTLMFILIGVLALWALAGWGVHQFAGVEGRGTFGDMFGAVNALFSGFAFACLIYAVFMQREELSLQRKELRLAREEAAATREEIKGQKEQAIAQNATLAQQTFDNTFFQMLRLHNDIVNAIDLRKVSDSTQVIATGRKCFKIFYERLESISRTTLVGMPAGNQQELWRRIEKAYLEFFSEYERDVGHYFRNLYNIVKFVDRSNNTEQNKRIYTNLVRAQLSSYELKLLLYNCLSSLGSEKFKPLVEKYSLLKSVNASDLLHGESDAELFDAGAFVKSDK